MLHAPLTMMPLSAAQLVLPPPPAHAPLLPSTPPAAAPPGHLRPPLLPPAPTSDARISPVMALCASPTNSGGANSCDMTTFNSQSAPVTPRSVGFPIRAAPAPPPSPRPHFRERDLAETLAMPPPSGLWHASLPSVGSVHHGTGRCKPCGWFWKASGCANGRECCHCHLCPESEVRTRRKAKLALIQRRMLNCAERVDMEEYMCAKDHHQNYTSTTQEVPLPTILGHLNGQRLAEPTSRKNITDLIVSETGGADPAYTKMPESLLVQSGAK